MKFLISYPRSGNHLVRFFIELLSGNPTLGCKKTDHIDIPIYQNTFPETVHFDIKNDFDKAECFRKYHEPVSSFTDQDELICIVRDPYEVLLRHAKQNMAKYDVFFDIVDFYDKFTGKKLLLYYEDILNDKKTFITTLYNFLDDKKSVQYQNILENIDWYFNMSANGKNRSWGGINSEFKTSFYYEKITEHNFKPRFDAYMDKKVKTRNLLKRYEK